METGRESTAVETLQRNERLKATSNVLANLGSALFIAAVARGFALGVDAMAVIWLAIAMMVIWTGIYLLVGLEMERTDG